MRLCFGSYLAVLVSCKAVNVDNKVLCEALLHTVVPNFEFVFAGQENPDRVREDASSKLLRCEQNLSKDVTDAARSIDRQKIIEDFKNDILPLLNDSQYHQMILALKDIIANDPPVTEGSKTHGIPEDTAVDIVGGTTKKALASQNRFSVSSFLAGVFLFVVTKTNNRSGKATIKNVNGDYILSFAARVGEIELIDEENEKKATFGKAASQNGYDSEFAEDVAGIISERINALKPLAKEEKDLLFTLLSESNGCCLNCGKQLGIPKRGKVAVRNGDIAYLKQSPEEADSYENAVVLCKDDCLPVVPEMAWDEKTRILENKRRCADIQEFLVRISGIKFPQQIEEVLREIHKKKNEKGLEPTDPKDLVEIEIKIDEPFLKDKINASMARLYKTVKAICGRLEQEIGFDTGVFGGLMKAAQLMIDNDVRKKESISDPQEYITKLLVNNLFSQVGQKHEDACEIIIGYLVKRCDLFNENAKQS